ncbi:MAG: D-arabinono-1,4-lactone oxidase [Caldilineaceae bacterium]
MPQWSNWSGSVSCTPHTFAAPTSEAEISACIAEARRRHSTVRVVGTGHSFVPLCASDEVLLTLDGLQGIVTPAPDVNSSSAAPYATFWAGTKIHQVGDPLWAQGLSMANMGDIDRQSLAGAISTGTHGTGHTLGNIATQVAALRLALASGEIIDCSPTQEPEIFQAAQVSLGALGVITQITLRCPPAYYLHERTWVATFAECVAQLDDLIAHNRHFEFFWAPSEDRCAMKTLNPTADTQLDAPHQPDATGRMVRYVREERIDRSYRIFPSERNLKFNEMEYAVPAANGPGCLHELRELMQHRFPEVLWPIEYRTLAADDIWLSPAYGRATVTISIHQAAELPYQPFFAAAEAIFRNHQGRPHWGKIHTQNATTLADLYPAWTRFQTVRTHLDPDGRFLNDHLRMIL